VRKIGLNNIIAIKFGGSQYKMTHSDPKNCMLHNQRVAEITHNYITRPWADDPPRERFNFN